MKMSANENESVNIQLVDWRSNNSNIIDVEEEVNRMERPSRVFNSRHHLSMPPVLTDTNNMEQNQQVHRSNDHNYDQVLSNPTQNAASTSNGDTTRYTITTNPATRQITAAAQSSSNNRPPNTRITTSLTSNNQIGCLVMNDDSEDDDNENSHLNLTFWRKDIVLRHVGYDHRPENQRSVRRSSRFVDQPYILVNRNFPENNNPSTSSSSTNRGVNFPSANQGFMNPPIVRPQTPEQELPEVIEHVMEPDNSNDQFDEVYNAQENILSVSSQNDADSGDDQNTNADEENRNDDMEISNETPRTRVVPFSVVSPTPFSPPPESPSDTPGISATRVNNDLPDVPAALPLITNNDDNHNTVFNNHGSTDYTSPGSSSQLRYVIRSEIHDNGSVSRTIDFDVDNTENEAANNSVGTNEAVNSIHDDSETISRNSRPASTSAMCRNDPSITTKEKVHAEGHPETYEDLNHQIIRLFECPVCFEHIVPPIYQCLHGHLICNKCVVMCENCPTCRNHFNIQRNLYMEKVSYLIKFPCRNTLTGCNQQMFIGPKEIHEQECCFRHYQCFFNNCAWKGYQHELHSHMTKNHKNNVLTGSEQFLHINLPGNSQTYKWFLVSEKEYFAVIVHSSVPPRRIKIQVNFIGPAVRAKEFKYCVQLIQRKKRVISQKLVYERSTLPYSEIYEMTHDNTFKKDIFALSGEMIEPFVRRKHRRLPVLLKVCSV